MPTTTPLAPIRPAHKAIISAETKGRFPWTTAAFGKQDQHKNTRRNAERAPSEAAYCDGMPDVMTHSFVCTSVLEDAVSSSHHKNLSPSRRGLVAPRPLQCRMHAMQKAPMQRRRPSPPMELLFTMMRLLISIGLLASGVSGK
jgi:hypothetical protein